MHALSFPQVYDWVWLFRTSVLSKAALFNIRLSVVPDFGSPHPVAVGNWFYVRKKKKNAFLTRRTRKPSLHGTRRAALPRTLSNKGPLSCCIRPLWLPLVSEQQFFASRLGVLSRVVKYGSPSVLVAGM